MSIRKNTTTKKRRTGKSKKGRVSVSKKKGRTTHQIKSAIDHRTVNRLMDMGYEQDRLADAVDVRGKMYTLNLSPSYLHSLTAYFESNNGTGHNEDGYDTDMFRDIMKAEWKTNIEELGEDSEKMYLSEHTIKDMFDQAEHYLNVEINTYIDFHGDSDNQDNIRDLLHVRKVTRSKLKRRDIPIQENPFLKRNLKKVGLGKYA